MRTLVLMIACLTFLGTVEARSAAALFTLDQPAASVDLKIDDQRSDRSKKGGRPGLIKPMNYLEDAAFAPSKISLFQAAVASAFPTLPQQVVLTSFDVVDSYAKRMGAAQGATIDSVSPAAAALLGGQSPDGDYILCLIEAQIDGRSIAAAAVAPYKGSAFAMNVYKDAAVVAAVKQAVADALRNWTDRAKSP